MQYFRTRHLTKPQLVRTSLLSLSRFETDSVSLRNLILIGYSKCDIVIRDSRFVDRTFVNPRFMR